ncbi:MAG: hypothetical protein ACHREM_05550 [Polyangiales bacterium]
MLKALRGRAVGFVVAHVLLAAALLLGNGRFNWFSLALTVAACACAFRAAARSTLEQEDALSPEILAAGVAIGALLSLFRASGNDVTSLAMHVALAALTVVMATVVILGCRSATAPHARLLALLLALYAVTALLLMRASPNPHIDVFLFQDRGAHALLEGRDPYTVVFENIYGARDSHDFYGKAEVVPSSYPYPPLSLFLSTIAVAIGRDPRLAYLACQLGAAALLFHLGRRRWSSAVGLGFAGLLLIHPRGLFVLEQAWTEPLIAFALIALVALLDGSRWVLGAIALALLFAAKQYSLLIAPLLLAPRLLDEARAWPRARWLVLGAVGAAVLTVPFMLWHPADALADVVMFQVKQPFREDALALPAAIAVLTGWHAPSVIAPLAAIATLAWVWRRLPEGAGALPTGAAVVYFAFFLTAKQAFCNYYYFVGALLLAAAVTSKRATVPSGG